jgi:quinol monooxygenase YgiN
MKRQLHDLRFATLVPATSRPASMPALLTASLVALLTMAHPANLVAQARGDSPGAAGFYAVSYVEVMASPAARTGANAAFERYRLASRSEDGFVAADAFEQIGRPGHYAVIETWRDQRAFDARSPAPQTALVDALRPIRVSEYDQRPYKTLSAGASGGAASGGAAPGAATPAAAIHVISHVDVSPDPKVAQLLLRLAEASRKEAGNLRFDVVQHMMRANHFTVIETWRSQDALDAHVSAAHTREYRSELQPLTGSPLDERVFKAAGSDRIVRAQ